MANILGSAWNNLLEGVKVTGEEINKFVNPPTSTKSSFMPHPGYAGSYTQKESNAKSLSKAIAHESKKVSEAVAAESRAVAAGAAGGQAAGMMSTGVVMLAFGLIIAMIIRLFK